MVVKRSDAESEAAEETVSAPATEDMTEADAPETADELAATSADDVEAETDAETQADETDPVEAAAEDADGAAEAVAEEEASASDAPEDDAAEGEDAPSQDAPSGEASGPIRLHGRARMDETEELLGWLRAAPADAPLLLDASEVENVSTPYILAIVAAARARAEAGSPAALLNPSPGLVDAFSDLGLFGDLMKMEIRA